MSDLRDDNQDPASLYQLGEKYNKGDGVSQDHQKAFKLFKISAEQGNSYAEFNLGDIYSHGLGVPQNLNEAFNWYQLSANHRNSKAQKVLGEMYENGKGTDKDYILAYMWYELYESYVLASPDQEEISNFKDLLKKKMTPEQIKKATDLVKTNPLINRRKSQKSGRVQIEDF